MPKGPSKLLAGGLRYFEVGNVKVESLGTKKVYKVFSSLPVFYTRREATDDPECFLISSEKVQAIPQFSHELLIYFDAFVAHCFPPADNNDEKYLREAALG
ncbi:hypothetical protein DdX_16555 [Ditylenchus destructor]|uniref:Uncharacterized protein n=1 Tax=Ditylenchus destructor TaxID=166010 RepID=A0AAD4MTC8_9BILA|nr:hypothetical protein DdX_16555 [Ditylenchus destructor]